MSARGRSRAGGVEADERWARAAWSFLAEPRHPQVLAAIEREGAAGALERLRRGGFGDHRELRVRLGELDLGALRHAAGRVGARLLVPGDPEWPTGLDRLLAPPYCLWVRGGGDLAGLARRAVAVVGSRAATPYGLGVAADLGEGIASRGWTVVSGAAYGIDSAAHRGALAVDGPTGAVLACGVDVAYPRAHAGLLAQVARDGAVVSEVPVGCAPYRSRFLARNRLIAALAGATVVVEAGLRSGSLSTAREARDHHLPVGVVPGPVTSATSAGCHQLARETQAVLVTDAAEAVELAAPLGEGLAAPLRRAPRGPADDLDDVEYAVWSAVPVRRAVDAEGLAADAGVDPARVGPALAALEAAGLVVRREGRWSKVRRPPGA